MDVFSLLSYINKVSLLAFFITTLVVGYQIYLIKKEKTKEQAPKIPDFKEKTNFNVVANYTSLPNSLTKKELKKVNYSKLVFLIISLLTIMVIIFAISLVSKNNANNNQAKVNPQNIITPTPAIIDRTREQLTSAPKVIITLQPTATPIVPTATIEPTKNPGISPTSGSIGGPDTNLVISPTEIILAKSPTTTPVVNATTTAEVNKPQVLPETGNLGKGLLLFGVAISTIFFSFLF
ncbi:MAG: hypothetical protein WC744_04515 [Patescibacteria group bacterium]|jgi:hypothetical protein